MLQEGSNSDAPTQSEDGRARAASSIRDDLEVDEQQIARFVNAVFRNCRFADGKAFGGKIARRGFLNETGKPVLTAWEPLAGAPIARAVEDAMRIARRPIDQSAVFAPPPALFNDAADRATEADVLAGPVIAVDLDSNPTAGRQAAEAVLGPATLVVASGGFWTAPDGSQEPKQHLYWRLIAPAVSDQEKKLLRAVRKKAAELAGSDPTAAALCHPLRWPGSWHTKGDPRLCRIVGGDENREIDLGEAAVTLGVNASKSKGNRDGNLDGHKFTTGTAWNAEQLMDVAECLPNPDLEWSDFNTVGLAFFDAAHGDLGGFEAFQKWTAKSSKHDEGQTEARWEHYRSCPPDRISGAWLIERIRKEVDPDYCLPARELTDDERAGLRELFCLRGDSLAERPQDTSDDLYPVLDIDDILSRPPPVWLIDRHIPEKSVGFLYGRYGSGKTFVALDMALTVASGRHWHGDAVTAKPGAVVLYLASEGTWGLRNRISAWLKHRGISHDDLKKRFKLIEKTISFMSPDDIRRLVRTVRKSIGASPCLIVVDTVSRSMPGADENMQKDMTIFIRACDALKDTFDCAVLGVHHANKQGEIRGSTVLGAAGDFVFGLERKEGASAGRLKCEKLKDAPDGWSEPYLFEVVAIGDGQSSLVIDRAEASIGPSVTLTPNTTTRVLEAMQEAWVKGRPWSGAPRALAERRADRRMVSDFGFDAIKAKETLALWEQSGLIESRMHTPKLKLRGYYVLSLPGCDAFDEDRMSQSEGIFA